MLRYLTIFLSVWLFNLAADGQNVPIGQWKDYFSYQQNLKVSLGPNIIYCTSLSGVFSYNLGDNSIEKYNRVNGLSDVSTSVARFDPAAGYVLVGYADGNIDVIQGNQVVNVPSLSADVLQGSKTINDICFNGGYAYLSCGQGILQFDMSQDIIQNTFNLSSSGNPVNVYGAVIIGDSIYAVTANGVYSGNLGSNLNTFQNWNKFTSPLLPQGIYNSIAVSEGKVFVNYSNLLTKNKGNSDTVYTYQNGVWTKCNYANGAQVNSIESSNGYVVLALSNDVKVLDASGNPVNDIYAYSNSINAQPQDATADAQGNIWIADGAHGLVESNGNWSGTSYYPPGPFSNFVTAIAVANNNLWITPGGYNQSGNNEGINNIGVSAYLNQSWYRILNNMRDINCIVVDPANSAHAFSGSWGDGIIEYTNNQIVNVYNASNSALTPTFVDPDIRVGGLGFDTNGNLWATCANASSKYLSVMKRGGSWQAFDFGAVSGVGIGSFIVELMVTQSNAKWMVENGSGILVYQDNGTFAQPNASNSILMTTAKGNGKLPSGNIFSMAEDKNGAVWVGTDQCVVVFYTPDNVLDGNHDWDADSVYVTQNGYTQVLMQNQVTTAIAIDGANRKWLGTASGGVFLMSADGTQQIYNFTTANSPLISNNINCITINPKNGEVLIGTDLGIVSFRSTATEPDSNFNHVYAFPNPVPHGYDGMVAITGLVANTDVKIATINGEIVYHTTSLGGQAIWNGTNMNGERVKTGVYLVFCSSPDGSLSTVTKLLFLN